MALRFPGAIFVILLASTTRLLAGDPSGPLMFSEATERAMIGEGNKESQKNLPLGGTITVTPLYVDPKDFGFIPLSDAPAADSGKPPGNRSSAVPPTVHAPDPPLYKVPPDIDPKVYPEIKEAVHLLNFGYDEVSEGFASLGRRFLITTTHVPGDKKAHECLHNLARMYPELPSEFVIMYKIVDQTGDSKRARLWLEKAIVEDPGDPEPWAIIGDIALRSGRLSEATLDFKRANELLKEYSNPARKPAAAELVSKGLEMLKKERDGGPSATDRKPAPPKSSN